MTTAEHYFKPGQALCDEPILYKACGLDGIYLCNGYEIEEMDGEIFTIVHDREKLHRVIALNLVENRKTLSPEEIRFIRVAMNQTQSDLARALGVTSQTVARWEKGQVELPGPADRMIRVLVMVESLQPEDLAELLTSLQEMLDDLDETNVVRLQFKHDDVEWTEVMQEAA